MKKTILVLTLVLGGCGDDSVGTPDAFNPVDARTPDAPMVDAAMPDAGPTFSGLILMADLSVAMHPELGHGGVMTIQFSENGTGPTPQQHVDMTNMGVGCSGDLFRVADLAGASPDLDEGTVQITGSSATIPNCTFFANSGYLCINQFGQSMVTIAPGAQSTATVTVTSAPFVAADVGRYLDLRGDSAHAQNNGRFPIVAFTSSTTVVIANPGAQASTFTGNYATVAAGGPVPGNPPPPFVEATDNVTIALQPRVGGHFPAFSQPGLHGVAPFMLTTASQTLITAMPVNGSAVTLACDNTGGNTCGGALTLVSIETTDGSVAGLPPFSMPAPTNHIARVNCVFLGPSGNIPAPVMALIQAATPTRVQTLFARINFAQTSDANQTSIVIGRALAGFTTP